MENSVMLLCDIGNTSYHFFDDKKSFKESVTTFNPQNITQTVYYISVNNTINIALKKLKNWINIEKHIDKKKYYKTMGIDRIVALQSIKNGIIIDAGSAITVDVVKNSSFMGGFIYPGVQAMQDTYANISPALHYSFNFECDLDIMPKNSQDAISYGYFKGFFLEVQRHNLPIILTGGDAVVLKNIFREAKVDEFLLFNSMKNIIKKAKLC